MRKILFALFVAICANNCFAYYQAEQGRWISRDPIEERGGINLYLFCANNGVDSWDYLGLSSDTIDNVVHNANLIQSPIWEDDKRINVGGRGAGPGTSSISCTKTQDKNTCEWYIDKCTVTWKRTIYMNRLYVGTWSASQVYGHEQGHLLSLRGVIEETIAEPLRNATNSKDEDPGQVDRKIRFYTGSYGKQLASIVKGGDKKQANHVGKNKTPIGVPPLPDSPVIPDFPGLQK